MGRQLAATQIQYDSMHQMERIGSSVHRTCTDNDEDNNHEKFSLQPKNTVEYNLRYFLKN